MPLSITIVVIITLIKPSPITLAPPSPPTHHHPHSHNHWHSPSPRRCDAIWIVCAHILGMCGCGDSSIVVIAVHRWTARWPWPFLSLEDEISKKWCYYHRRMVLLLLYATLLNVSVWRCAACIECSNDSDFVISCFYKEYISDVDIIRDLWIQWLLVSERTHVEFFPYFMKFSFESHNNDSDNMYDLF